MSLLLRRLVVKIGAVFFKMQPAARGHAFRLSFIIDRTCFTGKMRGLDF